MPAQGKARAEARPAPKQRAASARPALPREFIAQHKQRRIMDALAELTAEQGYEATKISEIVKRAGVARKTLYDNFEGKEEVFIAAFDAARDEVVERIETSCAEVEGGWVEKLEAGLSAFLGYLAEEPELARMCMIEALSATPGTTKRYEEAMQLFVEMAAGTMPRDERLPETLGETQVGGVAWIVYRTIRRGELEHAEDLLPELTDFILAPYLEAGVAGAATGGADE
jgi:AcrR family transcriptional regulator